MKARHHEQEPQVGFERQDHADKREEDEREEDEREEDERGTGMESSARHREAMASSTPSGR